MKFRFLLYVLFLFPVTGHIYAQEKKDIGMQSRIARFKEHKAEFLKKEMELTDAETKAFIPLVNELMDKKYEANRSSRMYIKSLHDKRNKTDADYKTAIEGILDSQVIEAELQKEYYHKFMQVLPIEKVYKYYQAEMKFMRHSLEKKEKSHNSQNSSAKEHKH